ncbi:MAG: DNA polymerase III subunit beta [Phototrophicales bacterium]|nr:MAG: DNA polymerase III subunit beta [Phototrophicales bacterium]
MRVSVLQENLQRALNIVTRAVPSRPTLPILNNVMISTDNARIKLSATNLDLGIHVWIGGSVDEEGATTVPAKLFYDLVSILSPERIDLNLDKRTQTLYLHCGGNNNQIKCIDAVEFPIIPEADASTGIAVPALEFKRMIELVAFSASKEENKPVLAGILTRMEGNTLIMAATDGYRLSECRAVLERGATTSFQVIIPARALFELSRIISDADEDVLISLPEGRRQVMFHLNNVDVVSSLIDGTFPDYERAIPKNFQTITTVYTEDLLRSARRAAIFARDNADTTQMHIRPPEGTHTHGEVVLSSSSAEKGSNESLIDASVEGAPLEIALNVRYLLEVLGVVGDDQIEICTNTSSDACLIRPYHNDEYRQFQHVIMPMRINN